MLASEIEILAGKLKLDQKSCKGVIFLGAFLGTGLEDF